MAARRKWKPTLDELARGRQIRKEMEAADGEPPKTISTKKP